MRHSLISLLFPVILLSLGDVATVTNVNGTLGKPVVFHVTVPAPANSIITWIINGVPVAHAAPSFPPECMNLHIGRCELYANGSLRIDNVSYYDEGTYVLAVQTPGSSVTTNTNYQLRVYVPLSAPTLSTNITSSPLIKGTNVTLRCDAGNQYVTSYTFYRDGQKITCSERVICRGSFLDFTPISKDDSRSFTCAIQNPVSTNTSNVLSLTVYVPVSNVTVTSNVSELVWPGLDSVTLRCSAIGTNVSFSWSLQEAPISGGRYTLTDNNAALIISPVSNDDSGSFVCMATNVINSLNSSDVMLNLAAPISAVTLNFSSTDRWVEEDFSHLYCLAQGSNITFSWSLNGTQLSLNPPYHVIESDSPPNSNLFIIPVSRNDTGPFTCKATNRANSETSNAANLNINWSPNRKILCVVQLINQVVQLGCSWPGGKPAANVTMIFGDVQSTSANEVYRNVSSSGHVNRSRLTCKGDQLGRTSSCVVLFEPPNSPDNKNNTFTSAVIGDTVNLTLDLQFGIQSRAAALVAPVFPASFSWFQGSNPSFIQTGGKFSVRTTTYASTLNIDKLSKAEFGEYKCVAENFVGSTTFVFNIKMSQSDISSSQINDGAIAGIVVVVIGGVTLIGGIAFFIIRKRKTPKTTYDYPVSPPPHVYESRLPGAAVIICNMDYKEGSRK